MHQHVGMNLVGLLWIEYAFHMTLIVAAIVIAIYFLAVTRGSAAPVTDAARDVIPA